MGGAAVTLDEARAHIGHGVVYRPKGQPLGAPPEQGVITEVRRWVTPEGHGGTVFVRYVGDYDAKATDPADLETLR